MPITLRALLTVCLISTLFTGCEKKLDTKTKDYTKWNSYLGGNDRNHYSTLAQISPENVAQLKLAWSYAAPDSGQMQMSPIIIDTLLYGVTAGLRAVALNAATGKEVWRFGDSLKLPGSSRRGVAYWSKENDKRIFYTVGSDLYALNALTGTVIPSFGQGGKIDLRSGLPASAKDKFVVSNTPGTIFGDLIIMPLRLSESEGAAPGDLMAFNVLTGAVAWVFHTIPHPGEPGNETWENKDAYKSDIIGGANNWSGMSLDDDTGILYVPTGSAAPDFYGGDRKGSNLYANCLLAIEAKTGRLLWHFQFTHHDLWDRDLPAPPNLITITRDGKKIPAVAQVTKQGYVYVFDRRTGKPLFDIEERPVPPSNLDGEQAWPTQPFPVKPKPFARQSSDLGSDDISPYADNRDSLKLILAKADKRIYAPPSLDPVLLLPGYDGGAEWGGTGADPEDGILYVNANEMAWFLQMDKNEGVSPSLPLGEQTYQNYCMVCHQKDRNGLAASGYPSLIDLKNRIKKEDVALLLKTGKGMMPGFPQIPKPEKEALLQFLFDEETKQNVAQNKASEKKPRIPYNFRGYNKFLDSKGLPAITPPWGTMHAIDLNTGEYIWSVVLGETPSLKEKGFPTTGSENYGGPVITANGLLFIAATKDGYFRAFDKRTGKILWEYKLPAPAFATPATYMVNGKQYIALACGGEKLGTEKGNQIIAFALEE